MPTTKLPARDCLHGVAGGCPYCRNIEPADDGPDADDRFDPCHTGAAARVCGYCAGPGPERNRS